MLYHLETLYYTNIAVGVCTNMILCNSSSDARLITACAVIYGLPLISILLSWFIVPWLEWFQLLEANVANLYLVEKRVMYARQSTRRNIFVQVVNKFLLKDAATEQFRKLLRIRHHYFGLRGDWATGDRQSCLWGDFLFHVLQNNMLFAMTFAHDVHPISRRTNRAIFACVHAFGLLMYVWLGGGDGSSGGAMRYVWNYGVVVPASMILRNLVLYMYGCPCMYSAKRSRNPCLVLMASCCIRTGSVIIVPLFLMSIYGAILVGRWSDNSCVIMSYLYTNVIAVGVLDILKVVPHFIWWCRPLGIYIGGHELVRVGSWLLERHQEELFTMDMPRVEIEEEIVWKLGPLRFVRYDEFMGREIVRDMSVVV